MIEIPGWWVIENIGAVAVEWISYSDNAEKVEFFIFCRTTSNKLVHICQGNNNRTLLNEKPREL